METSAHCMGCMAPKGNESHCPTCGWPEGSPAASAQHLPPGTLLHGKYLLGRALGQGGFGITYIARDLYLDRVLAIKEYFPRELVTREQQRLDVVVYREEHLQQYQYGMEKFLEEGRTLAKFEGHPNIVSVQDFFESHETAYLVMPYIQGVALSDYLKSRQSVLAFDEALQIMMPVMDALSAVHAAGMLHRDISPDNIYISRQGRVMILDFGAARHAMSQQNRQYSIILKPGYAPPEQYRQKGNQGPWTDVYAVAATFYQAITGTMPPDALERMEADTLQWPEWFLNHLPELRRRAIEKGLAPRTEERYQTITDFQQGLLQEAARVAAPAPSGQAPATGGASPSAWPSSISPVTPSAGAMPESPAASAAPESPEMAALRQHRQTTGSESVEVLGNRQVMAQQGVQVVTHLTIGRAMDNDIVIRDDTVSRYHARLVYENQRWTLYDLESTHGTYINGSQVTAPVVIETGSYLQFSQSRIYFDGVYLLSERGEVIRTLWNPSREASSVQAQESSPPAFSGTSEGPGSLQGAAAYWQQSASRNSSEDGFPQYYSQPQPHSHPQRHTQPKSQSWILLVAGLVAVLLVGTGLFFTLRGKSGSSSTAAGNGQAVMTPAASITQGTIAYDGGEYTGQLLDGIPHGEGTWVQTHTSGSGAFGQLATSGQRTYEGQWENGMKHGTGVMKHPDGSVQRGRWEQDRYMGRE